ASAVREMAKVDEKTADQNKNDVGPQGGTGAAAKGESGKMGSHTSTNTNGRFAIAGDKNNPDVAVPRWQALKDAETFGMVGMLASMNGMNAPTAPWGADVGAGNDPVSKNGNMWGATMGDAGGTGGLGLTGIGEGGGS